MRDDFQDVAERILAVANLNALARKQLPYFRALPAAGRHDLANLGADIRIGDGNMKKAVHPVFHGVFTTFGFWLEKFKQFETGTVAGHHMGDFHAAETRPANVRC